MPGKFTNDEALVIIRLAEEQGNYAAGAVWDCTTKAVRKMQEK